MKLNVELVRQILLRVEETPANQAAGHIELPDAEEDEVLEHIELLEEQGLLRAKIQRAGSGTKRVFSAYVERLTPEGHEFLSNAKNEEVWNRTQALVKEKGGSVSFSVFSAVLSQVALRLFGLG
jgi:predicted ArsR family transcriptional regulator